MATATLDDAVVHHAPHGAHWPDSIREMRKTRGATNLTAIELVLARCERMPIMEHRSLYPFSSRQSRRTALRAGGAILAVAGGLPLRRASATQATPMAGSVEAGLLLVQAFSKGSLFPTQGDAGAPPFTLILWDAADRGFFNSRWRK